MILKPIMRMIFEKEINEKKERIKKCNISNLN